jgi:hypothetical protein
VACVDNRFKKRRQTAPHLLAACATTGKAPDVGLGKPIREAQNARLHTTLMYELPRSKKGLPIRSTIG